MFNQKGIAAVIVLIILAAVFGAGIYFHRFIPKLQYLNNYKVNAATPTDCTKTSVGFTPLNDLGTNSYQGKQGGLYPAGSNTRPAAHEAAGVNLATNIGPMDSSGNPDPNGKYVLLSIGLSNTTHEFSAFKPIADTDSTKDTQLVMVDGAQQGAEARFFADPNNNVWTIVNNRLSAAGVTGNQVAVVWLKETDAYPTGTFPDDATKLQGELKSIVQNLTTKFPNVKIAYLSSRVYAGYSTSTLNPEPYAYQGGFAYKWLIEDQINGNPDLNYDPAVGIVKAPWLSWGPYMWADGLTARSDGLIWPCAYVTSDDGVHPSDFGKNKIANILWNFFKNDSTTIKWYLADSGASWQPTTPPPGDPNPPAVYIPSPVTDGYLMKTVTITAMAMDNIGVTKVEIYVDGNLLATKTTSPYTIPWNTLNYTNGVHYLSAKAYDAAGNVAITVKTVTVDNIPPTVSVTSPANNATVSGTLAITADASDNNSVTKVEFLIDNVVKGTDTTAPYSWNWNTTTYTNGSHTITARANDVAKNQTKSTITVNVSN